MRKVSGSSPRSQEPDEELVAMLRTLTVRSGRNLVLQDSRSQGGLRLALVQDEKGVLNLKRLIKPRPPEPPSDEPKKKTETRIQVKELHIGGVNLSLEKADGTRIALHDFGLDASIDATPATLTAVVCPPWGKPITVLGATVLPLSNSAHRRR